MNKFQHKVSVSLSGRVEPGCLEYGGRQWDAEIHPDELDDFVKIFWEFRLVIVITGPV